MHELFNRLKAKPFFFFELLTATLFISILGLASPLFVIQVLNRYITHGFSGTLITLTVGVLLATVLQFILRLIRTRIATTISDEPDKELAGKVQAVLARGNFLALGALPKSSIHETIGGLQVIQQAYNAASITAVLDAPFALLFLIVLYLLSPLLSLVALIGIAAGIACGWLGLLSSKKSAQTQQTMQTAHRGLVMSATNNIETVRSFQGRNFLQGIWEKQVDDMAVLLQRTANSQEFSQSLLLTLNITMSVLLYAVGAVLVVNGTLSAGVLIGANILGTRAFGAVTKSIQVGYLLSKASLAHENLLTFFELSMEPEQGTALSAYQGGLQLHDLGYTYPNEANPLFESLSLQLMPGSIAVVTGFNGSGKTTLVRLITALIMPSRGRVMADGIDLRQMDPAWWRQQTMYLPQEPSFLNTTIRQNILLANPGLDETQLLDILEAVDLKNFLDRSPKGLETVIIENGANLPMGIRRRIAMARALTTDGQLVVFDEPTTGLDIKGCQAVYRLLQEFLERKKTIIVVSRDPRVLKNAELLINLGKKPVPRITSPQDMKKKQALQLTPQLEHKTH